MQQLSQDQVSVGAMPAQSSVFAFSQVLVSGQRLELDLSTFNNLSRLKTVQGAFLDNSAGTQPLLFSCGAGQSIIIPPGWQGMFPIYWKSDYICNLEGAGNVIITLLNFPTPVGVWNTGNGNSVQNVQDVNLAGAITNGMIKAQSLRLGSDGNFSFSRIADTIFSGTVGTTALPIFGVNSGSFYLRELRLATSPDYVCAAAKLTLNLGTVALAEFDVPAFATASNNSFVIADYSALELSGAGQISIISDTAPTAGAIYCRASGGNATI